MPYSEDMRQVVPNTLGPQTLPWPIPRGLIPSQTREGLPYAESGTRRIDNKIRRFPATQNIDSQILPSLTNMKESIIQQQYHRFRILVIGRANAGKTTLLKRVCNTTDEPCIYDEKSDSLVRFLAWLWKELYSNDPTANQLEPTLQVIPVFTVQWLNLNIWPCCYQARDPRYQTSICLCQQPEIHLPWFSWVRDRRRDSVEGSPVVHWGACKVYRNRRSASCHLVIFAVPLCCLHLLACTGSVLYQINQDSYWIWRRGSSMRNEQEMVRWLTHLL